MLVELKKSGHFHTRSRAIGECLYKNHRDLQKLATSLLALIGRVGLCMNKLFPERERGQTS